MSWNSDNTPMMICSADELMMLFYRWTDILIYTFDDFFSYRWINILMIHDLFCRWIDILMIHLTWFVLQMNWYIFFDDTQFVVFQMNWCWMEGWSRNCEKFGQDQGMDASYWSHYGGPQGMEPTGQVLGGWNPGCDQQQGPSQNKHWSRPPSTGMDANFEVEFVLLIELGHCI